MTGHLYWPDIAKGIGIILVVLGHGMFPMHSLIDSFHMPLFFILAGMFLNLKKYSISDYTIKRFIRVMIPLLVYGAIIGIYAMPMGREEVIHHLSSLWFLYTIFFASVLYFAIRKILPVKAVHLLLLLIAVIIPIIPLTFIGGGNSLALIVLRIVYAMLFIHLGNMYMCNSKTNDGNLWIVALAFFVFAGCNYLILKSYSNLNVSYYTCSLFLLPALLFWSVTLSGSYIVIRLSQLVKENKFLQFLGRNSLAIYAIHFPVIWKLNNFIGTLPNYERTIYKLLYAGCEYVVIFAIVLFVIVGMQNVMPEKYYIYLGISKYRR